MSHRPDTDFACLKEGTLLIFTDFAAVMCLRAFQAKNSSVDSHVINDNFVCIYNRQKVDIKGGSKNDVEVEIDDRIQIFTVDVHHFFAEKIYTGKKNDHAMHDVSMNAIINYYWKIVLQDLGTELKHVIVWTNNVPHSRLPSSKSAMQELKLLTGLQLLTIPRAFTTP